MPSNKSQYSRGEHPRSQENLQSRVPFYEESKRRREVLVTQTGWDGFKAIAKELKLSASELVERIGRGIVIFVPAEKIGHEDKH